MAVVMMVSVAMQFRSSALTDREIATSTPRKASITTRFLQGGHEISWSRSFHGRTATERPGRIALEGTMLPWCQLGRRAGIESKDVTGQWMPCILVGLLLAGCLVFTNTRPRSAGNHSGDTT